VTARPLVAAALLGAVAVLAVTVPSSGANFSAARTNPGNTVTADTPGRYLHGYSQGSDPTGLTAYATTAGTAPVVPAATGADGTLSVALGNYKNASDTTIARVLVVAAPNPLPSGVASITVRLALAADPGTGLQPIVGTTFAAANGTGTCSGSTVTLAAGNRCQLNLTVNTRVNRGFSNNSSYAATVYLIANFPGYSGSSFLDYAVPVTIRTS
jgi:hypothetical protein